MKIVPIPTTKDYLTKSNWYVGSAYENLASDYQKYISADKMLRLSKRKGLCVIKTADDYSNILAKLWFINRSKYLHATLFTQKIYVFKDDGFIFSLENMGLIHFIIKECDGISGR